MFWDIKKILCLCEICEDFKYNILEFDNKIKIIIKEKMIKKE